ncbi:MAG: ABC transporter ATP-binding protein [Gammaproteobacteria bacterium]|nr:ABC transporter ATP-binding protein [Gammaproteobacteria bacterium]
MTAAIAINNLSKTYKNGFEALRGINLEVQPGDFFALLGPNGAGKSTTIGIISSLVNKSGGSVSIFGYDLDTQKNEAKSCIGLVPQEFNFNVWEPAEEILVNQAGYYGIPRQEAYKRAESLLKELDLWGKRREIGRNLSGGMKRRLMIARALVHQPRLLILDEPTAGVDVEIRKSMWNYLTRINREGTTIVLTTHYLEEAECLCRNIGIIDQGEILHNTSMKALLKQLNTETFVLDTEGDFSKDLALQDYPLRVIDAHTLEIDVRKEQDLNQAFAQLSAKNIKVISLRNKVNRLEELFIGLLNAKEKQTTSATVTTKR